MPAKSHFLVLAVLAHTALSQSLSSPSGTPAITPAPCAASSLSINDNQFQQISAGLESYFLQVAPQQVSLGYEIASAFSAAGDSPSEARSMLLEALPTSTPTGRSYLLDVATNPVDFTGYAFETALPMSLQQELNGFQTSELREVRQIVRSGLGLGSDADATQCAQGSTGGATVARPTMLAGGVFAAGIIAAAGLL